MHLSDLTIENFRCFGSGDERLELHLRPGLTALVGQNDCGKSAVVDALRFALGTADQEWYQRLEPTDFHRDKSSLNECGVIEIVCKFVELTTADRRAFLAYLTYDDNANDEPVFYVNWTAEYVGEERRGRGHRVKVRSGKNGDGPDIANDARDLLSAVYLRPLRDAEQALSSGRGSRLSQVLQHVRGITKDSNAAPYDPEVPIKDQELSMLEIGKLIHDLLTNQVGVRGTKEGIDSRLDDLTLKSEGRLKSNIRVSGVTASEKARLRELLEKLDLGLDVLGRAGLGSDNLLFMACELLLLSQEKEGSKLLLIEEPEAHLHAQRQLRVMQFLQEQAERNHVQVIITTHSPNLASVIKLDNLVMIHEGHAFSFAEGQTKLQRSDYRFLERFLDATKANLFFAHGVLIVEGDAENILLPTLARLIGRDLTEHGVSIVNVGGVGLHRYARIFQRKDEKEKQSSIPVACITDMDVMPNCAPTILGLLKEDGSRPDKAKWKKKGDFDNRTLIEHRKKKERNASGQSVKTFVSDEWTMEYDLAYSGLAEDVYVAARLAKQDEVLSDKPREAMIEACRAAQVDFADLNDECENEIREVKHGGCTIAEVRATKVYAEFVTGKKASKPVAAQYLAARLERKHDKGTLTPADLRARLPKYILDAIDYVTSSSTPARAEEQADG